MVTISEKRCGCYMHPSEKNDYNEAPEGFLTLIMNAKTIDIQKPNLGYETTKFIWARSVSWYLNFPGS
jgi:hypothetical protein